MESLNGLRGVLVALIVLSHVQIIFPEAVSLSLADKLGILAAGYRVPAFFALSGFVVYWSSAHLPEQRLALSWRGLISRRLERLYPAYLAAVVVMFCWKVVFAGQATGDLPDLVANVGKELLVHVMLLQSWLPFYHEHFPVAWWTMGYEFYLSLCIPGALAVVRRFGWPALFLLTGGLLFAAEWSLFWATGRYGGLFPPGLTAAFLFGLAAARVARRKTATDEVRVGGVRVRFDALTIIGALSGVVGYCAVRVICPAPDMMKHILRETFLSDKPFGLAEAAAGFVTAALCIHLAWSRNSAASRALRHPALLFLGRISYCLFLLHWPILHAVHTLWEHSRLGGGAPAAVLALLSVLLSVAAALLFHRWFEAPAGGRRDAPRPAGGDRAGALVENPAA